MADGHGSARSWRSDLGSRLAVRAALATLDAFCRGQGEEVNLSASKRLAEEQLPQLLAHCWRDLVHAHLAKHPFAPAELDRLTAREGDVARENLVANPAIAYGATLLTTLVTDRFIVHLQLGDGDILRVSGEGEVSRPVPTDERLFANETTSLSGPEAWRDIRVAFEAIAVSPPALIVLATDGYANSFPDDVGFQQVGTDFLLRIRDDGFEAMGAELASWLTVTTEAGSGDDITVGILCHE